MRKPNNEKQGYTVLFWNTDVYRYALVLVWIKSRNKTNRAVFEITEYTNIQINTLYELLQESLIRCRLTTKPTPPK